MRSCSRLFLLPEVLLFSEMQLLSRSSGEWKQASWTDRPPLFLNLFEIKDNCFSLIPLGTSSKRKHNSNLSSCNFFLGSLCPALLFCSFHLLLLSFINMPSWIYSVHSVGLVQYRCIECNVIISDTEKAYKVHWIRLRKSVQTSRKDKVTEV